MNHSEFGFYIQNLICKTYKPWISQRFKDVVKSLNLQEDSLEDIDTIERAFGKLESTPETCTTLSEDLDQVTGLSAHSFVLKDGRTVSVKTSLKYTQAKFCPRVVGQGGFSVLNYYFSSQLGRKIKTQYDIKELVWEHIDEILPTFIDYLFLSDILLWFYREANGNLNFKIIYRSQKPDMDWHKNKFTFSRESISEWSESNSIRYNNVPIINVQVHKNRNYKFRFNMRNFVKLLREIDYNNESLGMTAEKVICDKFGLVYDYTLEDRSRFILEEKIKYSINDAFKHLPKPVQHTGSLTGERGGTSKSSYDFLLSDESKLSLKTNWGNKVCPPEVGQPNQETFMLYFGHLFSEQFSLDGFKKVCQTKTAEMMKIYLLHLLDSDYLLWIYQTKDDSFAYEIIERLVFDFDWKQEAFSFTRDTEEWKESTTVKYYNISIGEFQVHSNRNSYKFRFNMTNLLALLKIKRDHL